MSPEYGGIGQPWQMLGNLVANWRLNFATPPNWLGGSGCDYSHIRGERIRYITHAHFSFFRLASPPMAISKTSVTPIAEFANVVACQASAESPDAATKRSKAATVVCAMLLLRMTSAARVWKKNNHATPQNLWHSSLIRSVKWSNLREPNENRASMKRSTSWQASSRLLANARRPTSKNLRPKKLWPNCWRNQLRTANKLSNKAVSGDTFRTLLVNLGAFFVVPGTSRQKTALDGFDIQSCDIRRVRSKQLRATLFVHADHRV